MKPERDERGLLFAVVALQCGIVGRPAVLEALDAWLADRSRAIDRLLIDRGALSPDDARLLRAVLDRHPEWHAPPANGSIPGGPAPPDDHDDDPDVTTAAVDLSSRLAGAVPPALAQLRLIHNGNGNGNGNGQDLGNDHDPFATVAASLLPPRPAERFQALRFHARGGLGEVWVARDRELHREVALKQIRDQFADDAQGRARFLLEAEITGGLEHPGIVPVYGLGTHDDGRPYYAMRFIRGDSLKETIDRFHAGEVADRKPGPRELALRRLLLRLIDVCNALAYAHSRGVIHRDIKPSNIMLGPYGETLLVDWGLAKALGRRDEIDSILPGGEATLAPSSGSGVQETAMGQRVGTPAYMSPEQAAGRLDQVGPASDVYSLGASLYTLLAGRPPVIGDDLAGLLARVERGEFSPPHEAQPWVDRALSAVCLKAMARRPEDRYGSPRTLAEDLERWLADEPVAAWREPRGRALRRWVLRHQAAVAAIVVALGAVLISTESYFTQRLVAARGRVEALESAEIRSVPELLLDLGPDRALVRNELRALADPEQADPGHRLRGNLALLPDEPARAEFLVRFVTDPRATPEDVLVIRQALLDRDLAGPAADRIIQALPGPDAPIDNAALRAFGTLAGLKPDWTGWPEYADPIARQLTHDELVWISTRAVVFEPIARRLTEPLRHIYADRSNPEARGLAFALLVEFALRETNPDQVEDLAALIPEASPQHASQLSEHFHHLTTDADRGRLIAALAPMLDVPARFDDPRAARQGRIAAVLAHLGAADRSWPLLRLDPDGDNDPAVRTELIHQFPAFGVAPELLVDRLLAEPDVSARRALVLSLGSYPDDALPDRRRDAITPTLLDWYRSDPDPGLHSAISWLLRRRWGLGGTIDALDRQLASTEPVDGRGWYVSRHGQLTFAVVRGPVEFRMGSTLQTDPDRNPDEAAHTRRIDRPFAIAAEEVTAADFASFLRNHPDLADHPGHSSIRQIPTGDCPAGAVSWYDAARFCNWASQLEGLPEGQWCYPEPIGPGMTLPDDHLERLGYRLPTEAEWEFACRAGTVTARPFGGPELRLDQYSWSIANASRVLHPVGSLKPNDLGLFDLIGNAFEWCGTPYAEAFPPAEGDSVPDRLPVAPYSDDVGRVLRGGAFTDTPPDLRSASRSWDRPGDRSPSYGFRLARTLPTAAP